MTEASVSNIVVRPARADDFDFVADLMIRALTPFYDGDHYAHARRIFDAHIAGGIDRVGQFSAGQYMFIAESDGRQVGVIHVVEKKQGTVKISPLIVDTAYRGKMGVGSMLLKHAEDFARSLGARQIYCTVAEPNKKALGFFLRKGFRITGTAKDHYKIGIDEHMLYKQLIDEAGFDSPNISVVPFDESQHADGARALILSQMSGDFDGVDSNWVDALFAGYRRMESGDVNTKFKIIFVAECDGRVVGVAGATPKKGRPIKLMPLVASSEAAFEALIIDLQGLLEDYGHKLYVHLVPEPWQVACLQRHGWSLEGVFPGGYAPNSVVQQWGFNFNKEGASVRKMRIKKPYFDAIMEGRKTLEVRVGYNSIKRLKAGGLLQLETGHTSGVVRIKSIRIYRSFADMLSSEVWQQIVPQAKSEEEALRLLRKIYPDHKERLGVHVIEVEK
ncbi:GNAT family N-acetyltransferase [Candidatus Nanosynbacter featherlites]|uniref:GNAT family N-acetyltransferase n=1 Tax=Candidatus Nanosynbacter featherlites TaxID=2572088 RepID=A0A4P9A3F6_9BACT|nr:GNAT family N-acetyltransferase [Candidatus Nanosynbacter featherlites]QCT42350.1 GNAT family N-acetyltransferase [Candidatus Nanosynbacter featherlites]